MDRVLIVQDDQVLATTLEMILHSDHHEVLLAGDGNAAIACADTEHPDIILMDIILPRRSGLDAARLIATCSDVDVAAIPIIAMSAGANLVTVAGSGYVAGVLPKPFDINTVIALVHLHVPGGAHLMHPTELESLLAVLPIDDHVFRAQQRYGDFDFTERERAVVDLLIAGSTAPEAIAAELGISQQLVNRSMQAMFRKTGTSTRLQLIVRLLASPVDDRPAH